MELPNREKTAKLQVIKWNKKRAAPLMEAAQYIFNKMLFQLFT